MKAFLIPVLIALSAAAVGEESIVTIPGQGWHLVVDVPPLTSSESANRQGRFSYLGADTVSGITFSINTENMQGGTNAQCRDEYFERARRNPHIVQESIVSFETPTLLGISYRSGGEYEGQPFTMANSHGYFVKNGKCVDLHVSHLPYTAEGAKRVENVVRTSKVIP